jgi:hypothetical protein
MSVLSLAFVLLLLPSSHLPHFNSAPSSFPVLLLYFFDYVYFIIFGFSRSLFHAFLLWLCFDRPSPTFLTPRSHFDIPLDVHLRTRFIIRERGALFHS